MGRPSPFCSGPSGKVSSDHVPDRALRSCAAQNAPRPQAISADGEGIAEAILLVFLRPIAPPAVRAGRKVEEPDALAKCRILRTRPDRKKGLIGQPAEFTTAEILLATPDE